MRIVLIAAQSLDGFITRHDEAGAAFTSDADKAWFSSILPTFDCWICGGATYRVAREKILKARPGGPLRVVLTRTPLSHAADARPGILEFTAEQPASLVASLESRGMKNCAILGGSQIYSQFLNAGLINEVWLTLEPRLFGCGTPLLAGRTDIRLNHLATESLGGQTLLLKYGVSR